MSIMLKRLLPVYIFQAIIINLECHLTDTSNELKLISFDIPVHNKVIDTCPDFINEVEETLNFKRDALINLKIKAQTTNSGLSDIHVHSFAYPPVLKKHNKKNQHAVQYAKNSTNNFSFYAEDLVHSAYKLNMSNAETLINFADEFPTESKRVRMYYSIFNEMLKVNGLNGHEVLLIGHRIKVLNRNFAAENWDARIDFLEKVVQIQIIEDTLTEPIKALILKPGAYIKNMMDPGTTFVMKNAPKSKQFDIIACHLNDYETNKWKVIQHDQGRYFQFQYNKTGESLTAKSENDQLEIFPSNSTDDSVKWEMIPINNGNGFLFKHKIIQKIVIPGSNFTSNQCSNLVFV